MSWLVLLHFFLFLFIVYYWLIRLLTDDLILFLNKYTTTHIIITITTFTTIATITVTTVTTITTITTTTNHMDLICCYYQHLYSYITSILQHLYHYHLYSFF